MKHIFDTEKSFKRNKVLDTAFQVYKNKDEIYIHPELIGKYHKYTRGVWKSENLTKMLKIKVFSPVVMCMFNNPPVWFVTPADNNKNQIELMFQD